MDPWGRTTTPKTAIALLDPAKIPYPILAKQIDTSYWTWATCDNVLRVYKPSKRRHQSLNPCKSPTSINMECSQRFLWAFQQFPFKLSAVALCFITQSYQSPGILSVLHDLLQEIRAGMVSPEMLPRYRPNNYEIQVPWLPTNSFKVVIKKCRGTVLYAWWGLLETYYNPKERTPGELEIHSSGGWSVFSFVLIPSLFRKTPLCAGFTHRGNILYVLCSSNQSPSNITTL